ncbi:hypothetical protein OH768_12010 [Streptomyces sp. NBC_01622]|nr:hypothetical protein OH768_12010 [Streptomyces sp. NBC_01622]
MPLTTIDSTLAHRHTAERVLPKPGEPTTAAEAVVMPEATR